MVRQHMTTPRALGPRGDPVTLGWTDRTHVLRANGQIEDIAAFQAQITSVWAEPSKNGTDLLEPRRTIFQVYGGKKPEFIWLQITWEEEFQRIAWIENTWLKPGL